MVGSVRQFVYHYVVNLLALNDPRVCERNQWCPLVCGCVCVCMCLNCSEKQNIPTPPRHNSIPSFGPIIRAWLHTVAWVWREPTHNNMTVSVDRREASVGVPPEWQVDTLQLFTCHINCYSDRRGEGGGESQYFDCKLILWVWDLHCYLSCHREKKKETYYSAKKCIYLCIEASSHELLQWRDIFLNVMSVKLIYINMNNI